MCYYLDDSCAYNVDTNSYYESVLHTVQRIPVCVSVFVRSAACGTQAALKSDLVNAGGELVLPAGCTVHIVLLMVSVQPITGHEYPEVAWPWAMTAVVAAPVPTEDGGAEAWEPLQEFPVPIEMLNCKSMTIDPVAHPSFYQMAAQTAQVQAIQQFVKTKAAFKPLV